MKTTMDLPDELVREVKLRAVVQGRTVKDLVAEYLRQGLGMTTQDRSTKAPASPNVLKDSIGIPFFKSVSDAPASRMTIEELLALEQQTQLEEDLKRVGITP